MLVRRNWPEDSIWELRDRTFAHPRVLRLPSAMRILAIERGALWGISIQDATRPLLARVARYGDAQLSLSRHDENALLR